MKDNPKPASIGSIAFASFVSFVMGLVCVYYRVSFSGVGGAWGIPAVIAFCVSLTFFGWLLIRRAEQIKRDINALCLLIGKNPLTGSDWRMMAGLSAVFGIAAGFYCAIRINIMQANRSVDSLWWFAPLPYMAFMGALAVLFLFGLGFLLKVAIRFGCLCAAGARRTVFLTLSGLLVGVIAYLGHDIAPVTPLHALNELPVPTRDAEESDRTLLTYRKGGDLVAPDTSKHPLFVNVGYRTNALAHAPELEELWGKMSGAREVMAKLDTFEGIADLWEPTLEPEIISFLSYRSIAQAYWAYSILKCEQGQSGEAARYLAQQHSVMRKAVPYSRTLVRKMICIAILKGDMDVVHALLQKGALDEAALRALQSVYSPLSDDDVSCRVPMIMEHLWTQRRIHETELIDMRLVYRGADAVQSPRPLTKAITGWLTPLVYNRNRTTALLNEYFGAVISDASVFPFVTSRDTENRSTEERISFKNPVGAWFITAAIPNFSRTFEQSTRTKVASDLLALEISHKLGESLTLNDPWTGEPYRMDPASGAFSSSGPDKLPDTKDDIRLPLEKWP